MQMGNRAFREYFIAAAWVALAQLMLWLALSEGDVTLVAIISQTTVLMVFFLTFLINRHLEKLNPHVILGGVCVMAGAALIAAQG